MIMRCFIYFCVAFFSEFSLAQSNFNLLQTERSKVKFQLIDNLIIIPIEVNGVTLSFLLDSGVSRPILFNIVNSAEEIKLKNVESVKLRGLGDGGNVKALKSTKNIFKIGSAININQDIYIITDEAINFSPRLGIEIHGIIGYDLIKDFIIEINYGSKVIRLNNSKTFKYKNCKKCETLPLTIHNKKPFIDVIVEVNKKSIPVKLLMDSGGSDALWLFEDDSLGLVPENNNYFIDFFGRGLSGSVHGKKSKVSKFSLNEFHLNNVNVAYPDSSAISFARKFKERNGSMGGELLRRFNIILDYKNGKVTFKKNSHFKDPFEYNKSGIIIEQDGVRVIKEIDARSQFKNNQSPESLSRLAVIEAYRFLLKPAFRIVELRPGSPAQRAGLKLGDIMISVNGKNVNHLKMQEINALFRGKTGKRMTLRIERSGVIMTFNFKLESLL